MPSLLNGYLFGVPPPPSTNLWAWWRANDVAGNDGDQISSVTDLSGNGRNLTGNANAGFSNTKPILRTSAVNGKKAFDFSGGGWFTFASMAGIAGGAEGFIVVKADADPAANGTDGQLWQLGSSALNVHFPFTDGTVYEDFGKDARASVGNPSTDLATWICYNVSITTVPVLTAYINGVATGTTSSTGSYGFTATPRIGQGVDGVTTHFTGRAADILLYSAVLTDGGATKNAVEAYISAFYGITFS